MKKTDVIKILISDDNPVIRKLIKKTLFLISDDFDIDEASDGRECLDKLQSFTPDLLLLDLMMPKLNGLKVLQIMANEKLFNRISVIVISGLEDTESAGLINCLRYGAADFIYKPFRGKLIVYKIINQIRNIIIRQNLLKSVEDNEKFKKDLKLEFKEFDFEVELEFENLLKVATTGDTKIKENDSGIKGTTSESSAENDSKANLAREDE